MSFNGDLAKKSMVELDKMLISHYKLLANSRLYDSRETYELKQEITQIQQAMNLKRREAAKAIQWKR